MGRGVSLRWGWRGFLALPALVLSLLSPAFSQENTVYSYDALGRLVAIDYPSGTDRVYCYDDAGNRREKKASGTCPDYDDGGGGSNNPPVAVQDSSGGLVTQPYIDINVTANDSDPDSDQLTVTAVTQPSNAKVVILNASTVRAYPSVVGYSPFQYTVSRGNGGTDTATVHLQVATCGWGC